MKNKGYNALLVVMFSAMIVIIGAIVVVSIIFFNKEEWVNLFINLMGDLLSAIVIGLFLGLITKIITSRLFSVELNMKKLRECGVQGIGTGKSDEVDIRRMFGTNRLIKKYPHEMKLMFLTGNKFLKIFEERIIKCLDKGCKISLLIASPRPENEGFLNRASFRYSDGKVDYVDEITNDSLKTVQRIKLKTQNPDNLKIRFYLDEYQNNVRISRYRISDVKEKTYYWINVQPLSKPAIDLSIALKGVIEIDHSLEKAWNEDKDVCQVSERGFDKLWEKYADTEYIYYDVASKKAEQDSLCV